MTHLEFRYENCGFIYTKRTRLLFAPKFTSTRDDADKSSSALMLAAAAGWPDPQQGDVIYALEAMKKQFPDREIFADGSNGLVLVYEPPTA